MGRLPTNRVKMDLMAQEVARGIPIYKAGETVGWSASNSRR